MKSIDEKIAEAEAEWRQNRYRDAGVRESAGQLFRAVLRSAGKRMNCAVRNICPVSIYPVRKRVKFHPSYDETKVNLVVSLTSTYPSHTLFPCFPDKEAGSYCSLAR